MIPIYPAWTVPVRPDVSQRAKRLDLDDFLVEDKASGD